MLTLAQPLPWCQNTDNGHLETIRILNQNRGSLCFIPNVNACVFLQPFHCKLSLPFGHAEACSQRRQQELMN